MNKEPAYRALDYIKSHPEKWDQDNYCGTACCIAGHVVLLEDGEFPVGRDGKPSEWHTRERAAKILKLTSKDDYDLVLTLFSPKNTIGDLKRIIDEAPE